MIAHQTILSTGNAAAVALLVLACPGAAIKDVAVINAIVVVKAS